jgi:hypothetical protein
MHPTYRVLMLSAVLLGAPLAMAQAQTGATGASSGNNVGTSSAMLKVPAGSNAAPAGSMPLPTSPAQPVGAYSSVRQSLTAANQAIAAGHTGLANSEEFGP